VKDRLCDGRQGQAGVENKVKDSRSGMKAQGESGDFCAGMNLRNLWSVECVLSTPLAFIMYNMASRVK
jgi:hypothetical protein